MAKKRLFYPVYGDLTGRFWQNAWLKSAAAKFAISAFSHQLSAGQSKTNRKDSEKFD
jgi:hypothetical protein